MIFVTLLGQGLTLPPLLRALKLPSDTEFSPDEAIARLETAQAALDRLDELEEEEASAEAIRRLRELYRTRFAVCVAVLGGEVPEDGRRDLTQYGRAAPRPDRDGAGGATGSALEGTVPLDVLRRIERDLDLDESRIRG